MNNQRPNLARLLYNQVDLPHLYRRKGGVWATQLPHVTVRWLGTRWCLTYQHLATGKILRYYAQEAGKLARWLSGLIEAAALFRQRTAA
jgi:hypothetical protein